MTQAKVRKLHVQFMAEHEKGMKALKRRDYDALGKAIQKERVILGMESNLFPKSPRLPRKGSRSVLEPAASRPRKRGRER